MPEIIFKGKEYVYNHHLSVPYRPLVVDQARGIGPGDLSSNLVIHGDNLHALKALLPRYAGKVDLVFIDPPYNTGNEGWCYNDNVNSPIMQEWLSTNPVDGEDMLRHDKWLCLMWPRLMLLRELLAESGSIWMTLDDNEIHRARMVMDEIFGAENFVANIAWHARESVQNDTDISTNNLNHVIGYAKFRRPRNRRLKISNAATWFSEPSFVFLPAQIQQERFANPDNDPRGDWKADPFDAPNVRENLTYPITNPNTGEEYWPPEGRCWRTGKENYEGLFKDRRIIFGKTGNSRPQLKVFASEKADFGEVETNWWEGIATTTDAIKELQQIFGDRKAEEQFPTPKPVALMEKLIHHTTHKDSLILDSFAGSGTTAHAVLKANAKDGGSRKFILVEGEDYADTLTAERVRRAIKGYAWVGTQREELLREKITFTQFKKADEWLKKIEAIKAREGFGEELSPQGELLTVPPESTLGRVEGQNGGASTSSARTVDNAARTPVKRRFDKVHAAIKDGVLTVEGEKRVSQMVEGLGGEFTYCTLGKPLDIEKLLAGEDMPDFEALGAWLFHTATGGTLLPIPRNAPAWYLGEASNAHAWLFYRPDVNFLKSPEAALSLSHAKTIAEWGHAKADGKRHLVFSPAKYLSNKQLAEFGIDYAPLPFALYREG